jgi:GNAT superfamily N-acetyltransferase
LIVLIRSFDVGDLPQLQALVNLHLSAAVPGWALSEVALARHLARDDRQPVTDPWVEERATVCALERYRLLAVAHLLRYARRPEIHESHAGAGSIAWFFARPEHEAAAAAVLAAASEQFSRWHVSSVYGWETGLPVPIWGVPDAWPHIVAALEAAGFQPDPSSRGEVLYGGAIERVPPAGDPPVPELELHRLVWPYGTRFSAVQAGEELGWCGLQTDLSNAGLSPGLAGWAWLDEFGVRPEWRNRGIGGWLVRHAIAWARLGRCDRVIIPVADANEAAGAGRFYRRFGWEVLVRERHGWRGPCSR